MIIDKAVARTLLELPDKCVIHIPLEPEGWSTSFTVPVEGGEVTSLGPDSEDVPSLAAAILEDLAKCKSAIAGR
jgi:hypothetical protein